MSPFLSSSSKVFKVSTCSIILLWSDGNIFSPVKHSYSSISSDDNANIFAASLLTISYYSFKSLISLSVVMIISYILSKRCFLKRWKFSDARVVSITKKVYGFAVHILWWFIAS